MKDQITDALKPTYQTSYSQWAIGAVIAGPFLLIGVLALANRVLPAADADAFKAPLLTLWASITGASVVATLAGGLAKTFGKIATQKATAIAGANDGAVQGAAQTLITQVLGEVQARRETQGATSDEWPSDAPQSTVEFDEPLTLPEVTV